MHITPETPSTQARGWSARLLITILILAGIAFLVLAFPAHADPFATASTAARQIQRGLSNFAIVIGGVGMVACLLLGFFGKLNWKWVATGIGVSFAIAIVPATIDWLNSLGG